MNIGLFGYGVVGKGTYKTLQHLEDKTITKICTRTPYPEIEHLYTSNYDDILLDDSIALVVEVMGGMEPAYSCVKKALERGKHVVTANKAMLSEHLEELLSIAKEKDVTLAFSASVGGGIPWLVNLLRSTKVNDMTQLSGIMNGTTNYMLSSMEASAVSFEDILRSAQEKGYAEADPTADIDGLDVRAKLALSCDLAFSGIVNPSTIPTVGIRTITLEDIQLFQKGNATCKLMAVANKKQGLISAFIEPTLYSQQSREASVRGTDNILTLVGSQVGSQSFIGAGAGGDPTSYAVVADIVAILQKESLFHGVTCQKELPLSNEGELHSYYLRTRSALPETLPIAKQLSSYQYCTVPLSVTQMHEHYQTLRKADEQSFFANLNGIELC